MENAIAQLKVSLETALNNLLIGLEEGDLDQSILRAENILSYTKAIIELSK